jgi:hypothetical protein
MGKHPAPLRSIAIDLLYRCPSLSTLACVVYRRRALSVPHLCDQKKNCGSPRHLDDAINHMRVCTTMVGALRPGFAKSFRVVNGMG